jgi:hypothetical protein
MAATTAVITAALGLLEDRNLATTLALRASLAIMAEEKAAECRRI